MHTIINSSRARASIARYSYRWQAVICSVLTVCMVYAKPSMASVLDIHFDQEQRQTMKETLAVGKSLELCGPLKQGAQIQWRFETAEKLDFNIHYHVGSAVTYPAKLKQAKTGAGRLQVEQEQTYCWMWTNRGRKNAIVSATLEQLK